MREVRRAAHHGDDLAAIFHLLAESEPLRFVRHLEVTGVPFETVDIELRAEVDPFGEFHGAVFAEGLHEGFGEGGEFRHRQNGMMEDWNDVNFYFEGGGTVEASLGGLRPM